MADIVPFLVLAAVLLAVLVALMWLAARVRRRGIGGDVMAVVDQVFRPTAHQSHVEIQAQQERRGPQSAPDGE